MRVFQSSYDGLASNNRNLLRLLSVMTVAVLFLFCVTNEYYHKMQPSFEPIQAYFGRNMSRFRKEPRILPEHAQHKFRLSSAAVNATDVNSDERRSRDNSNSSSSSSGVTFASMPSRQAVIRLPNVCIEAIDGVNSIVVYDPKLPANFQQTLKVAASANRRSRRWTIFLRNKNVPPTTHRLLDANAYFVRHTCVGNLHHFWADSFYGLYGVLKANKDLVDGVVQTDIYVFAGEAKMPVNSSTSCHGKERYESFIYALGRIQFHDGVEAFPETNTCFKQATFGYDNGHQGKLELERLMLKNMGVSRARCDVITRPHVLIIERTTRRITNSDELEAALTAQLNASVRRMHFERYPLLQQLQAVHCADVLVGVLGAGLAHFRFLPPGGAVLEIGWRNWEAERYNKRAAEKGIRANIITNCNATLSEHSWQTYFAKNANQRRKSRAQILREVYKQRFDGKIYKFADCTLDIDEAVEKTCRLLIKSNRSPLKSTKRSPKSTKKCTQRHEYSKARKTHV